ncbi:hypothetical protein CAEBREN_03631 [Caenorhabditis brenneri]|uniref:Uncharacterized protein n=1 Tax=Caenorhabditis brenneri TaxID=135651 RepID=G0PLG5_CAEBE|nr:hypothetical protein CAEBREN_03631 [Caenorhabditis brenneri]
MNISFKILSIGQVMNPEWQTLDDDAYVFPLTREGLQNAIQSHLETSKPVIPIYQMTQLEDIAISSGQFTNYIIYESSDFVYASVVDGTPNGFVSACRCIESEITQEEWIQP